MKVKKGDEVVVIAGKDREHVEAPISASNVMVIDGEGKATRVGYRRDEESGKNVRVSRRSGKDLT